MKRQPPIRRLLQHMGIWCLAFAALLSCGPHNTHWTSPKTQGGCSPWRAQPSLSRPALLGCLVFHQQLSPSAAHSQSRPVMLHRDGELWPFDPDQERFVRIQPFSFEPKAGAELRFALLLAPSDGQPDFDIDGQRGTASLPPSPEGAHGRRLQQACDALLQRGALYQCLLEDSDPRCGMLLEFHPKVPESEGYRLAPFLKPPGLQATAGHGCRLFRRGPDPEQPASEPGTREPSASEPGVGEQSPVDATSPEPPPDPSALDIPATSDASPFSCQALTAYKCLEGSTKTLSLQLNIPLKDWTAPVIVGLTSDLGQGQLAVALTVEAAASSSKSIRNGYAFVWRKASLKPDFRYQGGLRFTTQPVARDARLQPQPLLFAGGRFSNEFAIFHFGGQIYYAALSNITPNPGPARALETFQSSFEMGNAQALAYAAKKQSIWALTQTADYLYLLRWSVASLSVNTPPQATRAEWQQNFRGSQLKVPSFSVSPSGDAHGAVLRYTSDGGSQMQHFLWPINKHPLPKQLLGQKALWLGFHPRSDDQLIAAIEEAGSTRYKLFHLALEKGALTPLLPKQSANARLLGILFDPHLDVFAVRLQPAQASKLGLSIWARGSGAYENIAHLSFDEAAAISQVLLGGDCRSIYFNAVIRGADGPRPGIRYGRCP